MKRSREEELVEADSAAKGSRRESQGVELLSEGEGGEVEEELIGHHRDYVTSLNTQKVLGKPWILNSLFFENTVFINSLRISYVVFLS